MNALIFKKYLEIVNNKLRLTSFFILPIICFFSTLYFNIPMEKVAFYCPLCVSLLHILVFWNQENIVLSGNLIFTPLTPQKVWLTNAIFPTVTYYIYCSIVFIISICVYCVHFNLSIPFQCLFYGVLNIIPAIGITVFSTLSNIENTTLKQWIAAPSSLLNLFSFIVFLYLYDYFPTDLIILAFLNIIGIILFVIALMLNKKVNNENVLYFSDNTLIVGKNGIVD